MSRGVAGLPRRITAAGLVVLAAISWALLAKSSAVMSAMEGDGLFLDAALVRGEVVITKHDEPKAVVLSMEAYRALKGRISPALEELRAEWDAIVERMQTPKARAARDALFEATPEELGRRAVEGARKKMRG